MAIEHLYRLQELEMKEAEIQKNLKRIPQFQELKAVKEHFTDCQKKLQESRERQLKLDQRMILLEKRSAELEEMQGKLTNSLYDGSVQNPKELEAMQEQLNALTEQFAEMQDQLIDITGEKEEADLELKGLTRDLQSLYEDFNRLKGQYNRVKLNLEQEIAGLQAEKEEILKGIDEKLFLWYQEKRAKFAGSPVGKITENHSCSGCHTILPMALVREVREHPGKAACERCGRILFIPKLPV